MCDGLVTKVADYDYGCNLSKWPTRSINMYVFISSQKNSIFYVTVGLFISNHAATREDERGAN